MRDNGQRPEGQTLPELLIKVARCIDGRASRAGVMRLAPAAFMLAVAVALIPLARDWRSPVLATVRPWAFIGLIVAGVDLILISWDTDQYYRVMFALLKADEKGELDRQALDLSDRRLAHSIEVIRK